jgi:S1-C subfamily serine protease
VETAPPQDHALRRSQVRAVVAGGLGLFLQKVTLDDEPVRKDGRFHGFRIAAFPDPALFRGVDLRPGDVIVRINGMPIEHPEEALEVFRSLDAASELKVDYERGGEARQLKVPIVDDVGGPGTKSADDLRKRADASAP